jgi:hypothetical protein
MPRVKLIFFVCFSVGSIIFFLSSNKYEYRFLVALRNDFTALSKFIKKSLSITGRSLTFYTIGNVNHEREVITRNVPSIVSVDFPYTRYAGMIN